MRPSVAVRKSLRTALGKPATLLAALDEIDARYPKRTAAALVVLKRHARHVAALVQELEHAAACEHRYALWKQGKRYVE